MDYRVISIGSLSHHPLWPDPQPQRSAHATITLIRSGDRNILVDPSLPDQVITARLAERAGLKPEDITDIFLTNFRPAHRRGLLAFEDARWLISETERESIGVALIAQLDKADEDDLKQLITRDIAILKKCEPAPDKLAEQVDLFPLPGYTPGNAGLLLTPDHATVLIAGDAVPTTEHLENNQVLSGAFDLELARASFAEALEIADWIVPGHDNITPAPSQNPYA